MKSVNIATSDGTCDAHVFYPPGGSGSGPAVIHYMDALGMRPTLDAMGQRLADAGYVVLLPNPFYRTGAFAPFDPKVVFADAAERERLMAMVKEVTIPRMMSDTQAFLAFLAADPQVRGSKVGTVGYCMGGGFAFAAAAAYPERVAAAASIHGSRLVTDEPTSTHLQADKMRAEIYIGVAEIDRVHDTALSAKLENALDAAGVVHTIELYPHASHGFAVPDFPVYDEASAERHWERILALFERTLA